MKRIYQEGDERHNFNNGYVSPYIWTDPSPYKDLARANLGALANSETNFYDNKIVDFGGIFFGEVSLPGFEARFSPDQANGVCTLYGVSSTATQRHPPVDGYSQSYYDLGFLMITSFNYDGEPFIGSDVATFSAMTSPSGFWIGRNSSGLVCGTIIDTDNRKLQFNLPTGVLAGSGSQTGVGQVMCVFFRKYKQSNTVQIGYNSNPMTTYTNTHYTRGLKTITYRTIQLGQATVTNMGESLLFLDEQRDEVFLDIRKYYLKKWRGEDV